MADPAVLEQFIKLKKFPAEENPDGTYNIYQVPIFGELEAHSKRSNPIAIDHQWHMQAFKRAKIEQDEDGYLPPLQLGHPSAQNPNPRIVGRVLINDVKSMRYHGMTKSAIFADFLQIPADVYEKIESLELSHWSAQLDSWEKPQIIAVALLDEVPAYKFGILVPKLQRSQLFAAYVDNIKDQTDKEYCTAAFLFKEKMMKEAKILQSSIQFNAVGAEAQEKLQTEEPEKEKMMGDSNQMMKFEEALESICSMLYRVIELLEPKKMEMEHMNPEPQDQPRKEQDQMYAEENKDLALQFAQFQRQYGEMTARIESLESKLKQEEERKAKETLLFSAKSDLEQSGYDIDTKFSETLQRVLNDAGQEGLKAFIEEYKRSTPPQDAYRQLQFNQEETEEVTPVLGPQDRLLFAEFQQAKRNGWVDESVTFEQYKQV